VADNAAAQPIRFDLSVTGATRAASELDHVERELTQVGQASMRAGAQIGSANTQMSAMSRQSSTTTATASMLGTRLSGAATATSALGTAMARASPLVGGLASSIGSAGGAISGLTTALGGPWGIIGGGLIAGLGVLTTAMVNAHNATDEFAASQRVAGAEMRRNISTLDELISQIQKQEQEEARMSRLMLGAGSVLEHKALVLQIEKELAALERTRVAEEQERHEAALRFDTAAVAASNEQLRLNREQDELAKSRLRTAREMLRVAEMERDRALVEGDDDVPSPAARMSSRTSRVGPQQSEADRIMEQISALRQKFRDEFGLGDGMFDPDRGPTDVWTVETQFLVDEQSRDRLLEAMSESDKSIKKAVQSSRALEKANTQALDASAQAWTQYLDMVSTGVSQSITELIFSGDLSAAVMLASIGKQLVASGIKDLLNAAGYAISSFGVDPRASGLAALGATKIATGGAMAAGFGGAGDVPGAGSVPTAPPARPARPVSDERDEPRQVEDDRPIVVNIQTLHPTHQIGSMVEESIRASRRRGPRRRELPA